MPKLVAGNIHKNLMKLDRFYEFSTSSEKMQMAKIIPSGSLQPRLLSQTVFFFANLETCHKEKRLSGRATCFSCNTLISIVCIACPGRHGLSELVYVLTISCLFSGSRFLALGLDLNQKKLCNHYLYHVWWFAKSKGTS